MAKNFTFLQKGIDTQNTDIATAALIISRRDYLWERRTNHPNTGERQRRYTFFLPCAFGIQEDGHPAMRRLMEAVVKQAPNYQAFVAGGL